MSQQNKITLQSDINSQIADNTSGNISAADVRNNLINMTDSLLFNSGSQGITGSLTVTEGITGSLEGIATTASFVVTAQTASYVVTAQTASYVVNAQTASYVETAQTASFVELAQTASYVVTAQTASYVVTAQTASFVDALNISGTGPFALTGSNSFFGNQTITGSITVSGSNITHVFPVISASLDFADDTAAAAGGVPLGGLYRTGNVIQIRIN